MEETRPPVLLVASDALFARHEARILHPERPERLQACLSALGRLQAEGLSLVPCMPRDATLVELSRAHSAAYLEKLARTSGRHGALDGDTYFAPGSWAAAVRAAGAGLATVDALLEEAPPPAPRAPFVSHAAPRTPRTALALVRPPGHHARPGAGMGFCLLNNVAIAAHHALARGLRRIAIVDWDVHHGNGTQEIFYADPRVLYVSLHQQDLFPRSGSLRERGAGPGLGTTVNVPLSPFADGTVYRAAFERIVLPTLEAFAPELLLVSAGFDAHVRDPLGGMSLVDEDFGWMASRLAEAVRVPAKGRITWFLEGGYDLQALAGSLQSTLRGALGLRHHAPPSPPASLSPEHAVELRLALESARESWPTLGAE